MEDIKITYREVLFGLILFNVVVSLLFGSFPLIAGLMLKRQKLAWIGFAVAVVAGTMLGVIGAYIIAVVFLWLILRRRNAAAQEATEIDGGNADTPDA